MTTEEIWRPVKEFGDYYEVSNLGRVRSLDRCIILCNGRLYHRKGKLLKSFKNCKNGLLQVMLIIHKRYKLCYVHRLVADVFVDNPHDLPLVSHINGDDMDNRAENLTFISRSRKQNKQLNLI